MTPSFEAVGPGAVEVRVTIGAEIASVSHVFYTYYLDTLGAKCVAYGPGLSSGSMGGRPTSLVVQAYFDPDPYCLPLNPELHGPGQGPQRGEPPLRPRHRPHAGPHCPRVDRGPLCGGH